VQENMMNQMETVSRRDACVAEKLGRHKAFWERAAENSLVRSVGVFAPSMPVHLPQPDGTVITHTDRLTPDMVDPAAMIAEVERWLTGTPDPHLLSHWQAVASFGIGDLLPFSQPFFKIPWMEAMLGCPITMTEGQIWVERHPGGAQAVLQQAGNLEHDPWFQLYCEFLKELRSRLDDRFPVTANTLLRGPCDLVAAILGVQEACVGWIDQPELMAKLMRVCTDANLAVIEAGWALLDPYADGPADGGYINGWGLWAPGPIVRTQADHSTLLSSGMYEQQILPFDLEIIRACPYCVFHLHNPGLHVAPALIEVDELAVIEVVVDPYPGASRRAYEMAMYRKIQERKPLILDVNFPRVEEADWVLGQLAHRGLNLNARFSPETLALLPADTPASETYLFC
jgi:hypothetical protein